MKAEQYVDLQLCNLSKPVPLAFKGAKKAKILQTKLQEKLNKTLPVLIL